MKEDKGALGPGREEQASLGGRLEGDREGGSLRVEGELPRWRAQQEQRPQVRTLSGVFKKVGAAGALEGENWGTRLGPSSTEAHRLAKTFGLPSCHWRT